MGKTLKLTLGFFYVILVIFQVLTTNYKEAYTFNAFEIDRQTTRMNLYPPFLARLGYILEVKREVQLVKKLESNFFVAIDYEEYFPNRFAYIFAPFFFLGLFWGIDRKGIKRTIFLAFLLSLGVLTLLGPYAKYGPVIIYPFIVYYILAGFLGIFRFKKL